MLSFSQELMSQKTEKPSLSGQRLKTRKRGNYMYLQIQMGDNQDNF